MKKRKLIVGIISIALVLTVAYQVADQRIVAEATASEVNMKMYDNVDDLMKDTSLVVEATTTSTSKQIDPKSEYNDSYTLTEVKVNKIIKDDNNKAIIGQNTTVIEPVFTVDNGMVPGKTLMKMDEYTKLVPGAKYILFLNWSDQRNAYWIHALYQGKINLDDQDKKENDLYLKDDNFKKLKDSAIGKMNK